MKKLLRWLLKLIFSVGLLVTLFIAIVSFFQIPLDLTRFKGSLEDLVSKALKREVHIVHSIVLTTSLKPVFTLRGLQIQNSKGYTDDTFMYLDLAKVQMELFPLLQKKIHIAEIRVEKLHINLEEKTNGEVNWVVSTGNDQQGKTVKKMFQLWK